MEVWTDQEKTQLFREALDDLYYTVVSTASIYQFEKPFSEGSEQTIKVDILGPLPDTPQGTVKWDNRRIKPAPTGSVLHGRVTPEAVASSEPGLTLLLEGTGTQDQHVQGEVQLPHLYTQILMKLFAFRDEFEGRKKGDRTLFTRKHLVDVYTLVALMGLQELDEMADLQVRYTQHPRVLEAQAIIEGLLLPPTSPSRVMLQEAGLDITNIDSAIQFLHDLYHGNEVG